MKSLFAIALIALSALSTGCSTWSVPEGQNAHGTTAMTRWLHPEKYQALVDANDPATRDAFAKRYQSGTSNNTIQK